MLPNVLGHRNNADAIHIAPLYAIDLDRLRSGDQRRVFDVQVGLAHTILLGGVNKSGELKTVGVLLIDHSQAARDEFLLCTEVTGAVFVDDALLPEITRLASTALDNPGQRSAQVIAKNCFRWK